jgi:hypothetical protein
MEVLQRQKKQLPMALVLEDEQGRVRVLEVAPARDGKLGAYLRDPGEAQKREILTKIKKK